MAVGQPNRRDDIDERFQHLAALLEKASDHVARFMKGKPEAIELSLVGLIARGHLLIEDIPGVGKSTLAQALAGCMGLSFQRIQFTSDLLPSDILGVSIFEDATKAFRFRPGPIFANVILADEINRSTPKTQSALLEAMNDGRVTMDGQTHELPAPFLVLATQNPVDSRGTFPLPESQLDRFMMRLRIGYPGMEDERRILRERPGQLVTSSATGEMSKAVLSPADLQEIYSAVREVQMAEPVETYLLHIMDATRRSDLLALGGSTRSTLALAEAARARALLKGRGYCIPDDVKALAVPVLAHRVLPENRVSQSLRRSQDTEDILAEILSRVPVPL